MKLSYVDLLGDGQRHQVTATVTTDHPASSYGQPVIVLDADREVLDLNSWILLNYTILEASEQEMELLKSVPMLSNPDESLYNSEQAGEMTGRKAVTVRQLAQAHQIGKRIGRDWVFTDDDIMRLRSIPKPGRPPFKKAA